MHNDGREIAALQDHILLAFQMQQDLTTASIRCRFLLGVVAEVLDQQDDGAVMQDLVWGARRRIDDPMSVEATLKQRVLRYDNRRSNAGKGPAWLLTLARGRIFPATRRILNVFIRSASPGNSFISQAAIISSVSPGVT
jgi:hypothetical protein